METQELKQYVKELVESKEQTLNTVVDYIINTVVAKALFKRDGWKEVYKKFGKNGKYFNPNFSISDIAIYKKLREDNVPISARIEDNMLYIQDRVNKKLGTAAVRYFKEGKAKNVIDLVI